MAAGWAAIISGCHALFGSKHGDGVRELSKKCWRLIALSVKAGSNCEQDFRNVVSLRTLSVSVFISVV